MSFFHWSKALKPPLEAVSYTHLVSDAEGIYWIDEDTFMAKGWRQIDGKWYYLRSNGAMAKNYWEESQDGVWYYLGADGVMMTNATTPDGYRVGADGAWIR